MQPRRVLPLEGIVRAPRSQLIDEIMETMMGFLEVLLKNRGVFTAVPVGGPMASAEHASPKQMGNFNHADCFRTFIS